MAESAVATKVELRLVETKVDDHIEDTDRWKEEIKELQKDNADNIKELVEATQPLVDALVAVNAFHRFIKWLSGFAVVAAAVAWLSEKWPL